MGTSAQAELTRLVRRPISTTVRGSKRAWASSLPANCMFRSCPPCQAVGRGMGTLQKGENGTTSFHAVRAMPYSRS